MKMQGVLFGLVLTIAVVIFIHACWRKYRLIKLGRQTYRFDRMWERIRYSFLYILAQRCVLKSVSEKDYSGMAHAVLFWGFLMCAVSYIFVFFEALGVDSISPFLESNVYGVFICLVDIASVVIIGVIILALHRRYIVKPDRLEYSRDAAIILVLILSLMVSYLFQQSLSIIVDKNTLSFNSPVSLGIAGLIRMMELDGGLALTLYKFFWWLHVMIVLGFLIFIPYSKHLHMIVSPFNILFKSHLPKGELETIQMQEDRGENFGVGNICEFSWKQLLDLFSCAECGRCQANCPAYLSGKALSPKEMIKNLKICLLEEGSNPNMVTEDREKGKEPHSNIIGQAMTEAKIWDCTTCYACQEQCPVGIDFVDKIVDLRRYLVLSGSKFPEELDRPFRNMETYGDPLGMGAAYRTDWVGSLGIKKVTEKSDYLFWVGCNGAFDDRTKQIATSLSLILTAAGIDFGILGEEENCCGDSARRLGNEHLFQSLAKKNIESLNKYRVRKIVTFCPHGYNVLKNEYPKFGGNFEVVHATQLIFDLIRQGKIKPNRVLDGTVLYHDPCYLGRYNDCYDSPRKIIGAVSKNCTSIEMARSREESFCCGAGGGRVWMEESVGRRISHLRVEEAVQCNASAIVTSCPFCLMMFEDAVKALDVESSLKVMDISEIIERSI